MYLILRSMLISIKLCHTHDVITYVLRALSKVEMMVASWKSLSVWIGSERGKFWVLVDNVSIAS